MENRSALSIALPIVTAVLFLTVGLLTFGVEWEVLFPDGSFLTRFFGPPLLIAIVGPLLVGFAFALRFEGRRAIGATLVGLGFLGAAMALGTIVCLHSGGYGGSFLREVHYNGDILRFGSIYPCYADPNELGLLGAYGVVTLGAYITVVPAVLHPDRWRAAVQKDSATK